METVRLERITMNVPEDLLLKASQIAKRQHRNRSEVIRDALNRFIKETEEEELKLALEDGYKSNAALDTETCKEWEHIEGEGL